MYKKHNMYIKKYPPSHTKFEDFFNPLAKNIMYANSFFKIILQSVVVWSFLRPCKLPVFLWHQIVSLVLQ